MQGYYLGFVTLSVAMVFPELLVAFNDYTNGVNGISCRCPQLQAPILGGLSGLSLLVIALTSATLLGHAALRRTRLGRRMRVAAVSPEAALTLGFSPGHVRSAAFVIAALGTGLAGILYVPVVEFLSPSAFHVELSIFFFFSVIVGGRGRLLGPILGVFDPVSRAERADGRSRQLPADRLRAGRADDHAALPRRPRRLGAELARPARGDRRRRGGWCRGDHGADVRIRPGRAPPSARRPW